MKTFTLLNRIEIDILEQMIQEQTKEGNEALAESLRKHRKDIIKEHNIQAARLNWIKEDDPEMYKIIYWRYVHGKSWRGISKKLYPDLISYDGAYLKKRYYRYMEKHFSC